jgi:colicin import membrane protein
MRRITTLVSLAALVWAACVLAGCQKKTETPPEPNEPAVKGSTPVDANAAAEAAAKAAADAKAIAEKDARAALQNVLDLIKEGKLDEAETALKDLEAKSDTLPADLQAQIKAARTSLDAAKKAKAATDAKAAAEKDARAALQKVLDLVKAGKLDEAEAALKDLEGKSGGLPADLQGQIKAARTSLDAAKAAQAAAAQQKEAQSLLERLLALIKENKLADAEVLLKRLEAMEGLPQPLQDKVKAAAASLTAAKAAGAFKLPVLPK